MVLAKGATPNSTEELLIRDDQLCVAHATREAIRAKYIQLENLDRMMRLSKASKRKQTDNDASTVGSRGSAGSHYSSYTTATALSKGSPGRKNSSLGEAMSLNQDYGNDGFNDSPRSKASSRSPNRPTGGLRRSMTGSTNGSGATGGSGSVNRRASRLHRACLRGDFQAVFLFAVLDKDPIDEKDGKGLTPLASCVKKCASASKTKAEGTGKKRSVKSKAEVEAEAIKNVPLHLESDPHLRCAQILLYHKVRHFVPSRWWFVHFLLSVLACILTLLARSLHSLLTLNFPVWQADVNLGDVQQNSPLHHAYRRNVPTMASLLMAFKAKQAEKNKMSQTPEQLSPVEDRHFEFRAKTGARPAEKWVSASAIELFVNFYP